MAILVNLNDVEGCGTIQDHRIKQKTHLEHENKKLYYRCELPLSIHIYSTVTNPRNSHNNLQHTFKSKLFKAYAVKDLLNYPFSTRKLKQQLQNHLSSLIIIQIS